MKNIARKTNGFQKTDQERMTKRINRLRQHFDTLPADSQETILKMLSEEIKHTENEAVKYWLMHFRDILASIHRGAFEPLALGGANV